jgi:hypothetical protein
LADYEAERAAGQARGEEDKIFIWEVERGARNNYDGLGRRLAAANSHLNRNGTHGHGLVHVLPDGTWGLITKAAQLAPVIVDALPMKVMNRGKVVSELPSATHLNAMLRSDTFLANFRPVDQVTRAPLYDADFCLVSPGYHDNGDGRRLLYLVSLPEVADSIDTIQPFLEAMPYATPADKTNVVAAALTVLLRDMWRGQKPLVLITVDKSHSGKGTTTDCICGSVGKADIQYENIGWTIQIQFQRQVRHDPEIGVMSLPSSRSSN